MVINQLQTICNWFSKQPFPVQATVVTTAIAIHGAALGGLVGGVAQVAAHVFPKRSLAIKAKFASSMVEARMFAAVLGTHSSIYFIMGNIRGKDDVYTRMAAGFGAGAAGSILKEVGLPPGPRLLILDHIENDPELQKMRHGRARRN
ncbi:chloroplastic import inner membrane translocase subunit HP30-2-like [Papaver somniferum]|uniref:chloroplastic import inner membrane translocase subunit HP30-2-like n=1 Tax=Papaver somniferum TaxID=3469 RepID=UPI000E6F4D74|nr:chloroplastic import inner membrane translocase subunit HP30-2-like [Papaver somniferum]